MFDQHFEDTFSQLFNDFCKNNQVQKMVQLLDSESSSESEIDFKYKKLFSFKERVKIFQDIHTKYPYKIPIIIEFANDDTMKPLKLVVDYDEIALTLLSRIRKVQKKVDFHKSVFILQDNNQPVILSKLVGDIYKEYLCSNYNYECDKILYLMVYTENTFG